MVPAYDDAVLAAHGLGGFCMADDADPTRERLMVLWRELRAQEARFAVSEETFVSHVLATVDERARSEDVTHAVALERLVIADIYLALACLAGNAGAVQRFLDRFGAYLHKLSHQFVRCKYNTDRPEPVEGFDRYLGYVFKIFQ